MTPDERTPEEIISRALSCAEDECAIEEHEARAAREWLASQQAALATAEAERDEARAAVRVLYRAVTPFAGMSIGIAYDSDGIEIDVCEVPDLSPMFAALADARVRAIMEEPHSKGR